MLHLLCLQVSYPSVTFAAAVDSAAAAESTAAVAAAAGRCLQGETRVNCQRRDEHSRRPIPLNPTAN